MRYSPGTEALLGASFVCSLYLAKASEHNFSFFSGYHLLTLPPQPCSTVSISIERELLYMSGAFVFAAGAQETPLDLLALEARGFTFLGSVKL